MIELQLKRDERLYLKNISLFQSSTPTYKFKVAAFNDAVFHIKDSVC